MNLWVMQDKIKRGLITYEVGDEVVCFHRKSNRHPRPIKDNIVCGINTMNNVYCANIGVNPNWIQLKKKWMKQKIKY